MTKLYQLRIQKIKNLKPKKQSLAFLINFSKAYSVIKVGKITIENIAN